MPVARATKAASSTTADKTAVTAPTTRRTTRAVATKRVDDKADEDELVKGLGSLNIESKTQAKPRTKTATSRITKPLPSSSTSASASALSSAPAPAVSATATTAASSSTTTSTTRKPATTTSRGTVTRTTAASASASASTASKGRLPSTTAQASSSRTAVVSTVPAKVSSIKGKERLAPSSSASAVEASLPWAQPITKGEEGPVRTHSERVASAAAALNTSVRQLSAAVSSGYRHSTASIYRANPSQSNTAQVNGEKDEKEAWSDEKVDKLVEIGRIGVRVLREEQAAGRIVKKEVEIERSCQNLVTKCLGLGMYEVAIEIIIESRPFLLRLYDHRPPPFIAIKKPQAGPSTPKITKVRAANKQAGPSSSANALPKEWVEIAQLPAPKEEVEVVPETLRTVIFSTLMATWISLVTLSKDPAELVTMLPIPSSPFQPPIEHQIHPLCLATTLPLAPITQHFYWLYRQISFCAPPVASLAYLHLEQFSFYALAWTISSAPGSKAPPNLFWERVHRTVRAFVNEDEGKARLAEAARFIDEIVDWTERVMEQKKEKGWYEGQGWTALVETWIGLGRRLGDSEMIDKSLALLTAGTTISDPPASSSATSNGEFSRPSTPAAPSTPANTAPSTLPPASAMIAPKMPSTTTRPVSQRRRIKNPSVEIARISGDLAKASIVLDKALSSTSRSSPLSAVAGLQPSEIVTLAEAVCSLPQDDDFPSHAGKAIRAWERVRRAASKAIDQSETKPEIWAKVVDDIRTWLRNSLDCAEILLHSELLNSDLAQDVAISITDTVDSLHRADYAAALPDLVRAKAILDAASAVIGPRDLVECLRCLSLMAYNGATRLYRQGTHEGAKQMTLLSCEWGAQGIRLADAALRVDLSAKERESLEKSVTPIRRIMSQRWELLAGCYQRTGDTSLVFTAYARCVASQLLVDISKLAAASSSTPIAEAFASHPALSASLSRLAKVVICDTASYITHGTELITLMREAGYPVAAVGAIGERFMDLLQDIEWNQEGAKVCFEIADWLLELYDPSYPTRRIRLLGKILNIITTSGQQMERFQCLTEEIDRLALQTDLGEDLALRPYRSEYVAYTLLVRSMQAYHSSPSPSSTVLQTSQQAVRALREIVLPPTSPKTNPRPQETGQKKVPLGKSMTTKVAPTISARGASRVVSEPKGTVRKTATSSTMAKSSTTSKTARRSSIAPTMVFDDLQKLTRLLGSLASLLGLLGHTMQQIEVLKLLRAFQRNKEDLVDDYVQRSGQLATEYQKLGKVSRAGFVFAQALRVAENSKVLVSPKVKIELLLRHACHLASKGEVSKSQDAYTEAAELEKDIVISENAPRYTRVMNRCDRLERATWAKLALAHIYAAQENSALAILQLAASFRLSTRMSDVICQIAFEYPTAIDVKSTLVVSDDPFGAPPPKSQVAKPAGSGADEPSKDSQTAAKAQNTFFTGKHLYAHQWHVASTVLSVTLDLTSALAHRGSARDVEQFLKYAARVAEAVKSDIYSARVDARQAELCFRMRQWEETGQKLEAAAIHLDMVEGPDMADLNRLKGDLYSRTEMIEEAGEVFESTSKELAGLDAIFTAAEAIMPSPKKNALLAVSTSSARASFSPSKSALTPSKREPLLPLTLAHVLRQHAWLLSEAGSKEECEILLAQIKTLPVTTETKAEELLLKGRLALHEAFNTFKTDLFMSSLTESAVAMPMGNPSKRPVDRQSTRLSIQSVLTRAEEAFLSALSMASGSGRIEGIRQACLALALLKAFQTSLGQGSGQVTASAAHILASSLSITLRRELLEVIECKFTDPTANDLTWFSSTPFDIANPNGKIIVDTGSEDETDNLDDHNGRLRAYWDMIKAKYSSNPIISNELPSLDSLPPEWAVISINVTDDHNTMFISRQQRNCEPIVFCLPLDRQGRREGDTDDLWTFDAAVAELADIIKSSNDLSSVAREAVTKEQKAGWWVKRHDLDNKMKELCQSLEFVWLGAFKTIFSSRSRSPSSTSTINDFRTRLEKIFDSALSSTSGGINNPRSKSTRHQVHLEDSLLECFARLSSKAKDEEIEDLVYFVLDVYQFHGVPVALSELDIDQIAIDVKGALERIETRFALAGTEETENEHIFLALDKNVQAFPWESIPILRGRAVSRIPSLSFLLDQVAMGVHLRPSLTQTILQPTSTVNNPRQQLDVRRTVNSRRTFYILNPSGDLRATEAHFRPWIEEMVAKAGWKGIVGRPPTEMEMAAALKDYDLVLYIGHGGAEQYIRSHMIRNLPQCATTMLWGCSSGSLADQGDLDRAGTAWNYMLAGCPSLVANLWDVTDRDIDRLSFSVLKSLNLDAAHVPKSKSRPNTLLPLSELSTVQAVNRARDECRLHYLTGAAPVVYGLPVYLH